MIAMETKFIRLSVLMILAVMPVLLLFLAKRSLSGFEGLRPGDRIPEARLQQLGGSEIETGSWQGNPTLLVVFNPDCRACRLEIEGIASVSASFPGVRIALLSTKLPPLEMETPLPVYNDRHGEFLAKVRKLVTPAVYWIDASGTVRQARIGRRSSREEEELFRQMLAVESSDHAVGAQKQRSR